MEREIECILFLHFEILTKLFQFLTRVEFPCFFFFFLSSDKWLRYLITATDVQYCSMTWEECICFKRKSKTSQSKIQMPFGEGWEIS